MEKFIAGFGEVMLRLAPAGKTRFAQALPGTLEATYGGGEANVCASLAILGAKSRYLTALPVNPVSNAFATQLRGLGVDVDRIRYTKQGRMGVYYAEHGAAQRGSNVVYDREHSVISESAPEDYDFAAMLENVGHLHISGITPALSEQIVAFADIIIGNEEDASDVFGIVSEGTSVESGKINIDGYREVARKLGERFPKSSFIAITLRESYSADHNNWGGMLYEKASGKAFFAPLNANGEYAPYEIRNIVDRFGGGDSFCAGLIFALSGDEFNAPDKAIRFAVAASCLKHSVKGDYNYTTKDEVVSLMNGYGSGRVKR